MTKNFKKNGGGSKPGTPQAKTGTTPKQTPKSDNKNNVKFDVDSDNDLTAADIEAVMSMGSGKKQAQKQTLVQNNEPNSKKNTPSSSQKQTTPASNKNNKKRQREDSEDEKDEEGKSPEKKKLIFSPEKKTPVSQKKAPAAKTPVSQKKAPAAKTPNSQTKKGAKAATPVPVEKKETPLKSILKKRAREEDEDEEEEVKEVSKKIKVEATPKKGAEPTPKKGKEPTPKKGKASDKIAEEPKKNENEMDMFKKGMEERDNKILIVKKINHKVKEEDVKKLSSDIVDVTMKVYYKSRNEGGRKIKESYTNAYLTFADEKTAVSHAELLKSKELMGEKCQVDFVGTKSDFNKGRYENVELDLTRLYVSGFDKNTVTVENLQAAFPNSVQISLPMTKNSKKSKGFGFVSFPDMETCKTVLNEKKSIDGRTLSYTYAKVLNMRKPKVDIVKSDNQLQAEVKKEKDQAKKNKKEVAKKTEVTTEVTAVVAAKSKKELAKLKKEEEEKMKKLMEEDDDEDDDDDDDEDDDDEDEDDDEDDDDEDDDDEDDDDEEYDDDEEDDDDDEDD